MSAEPSEFASPDGAADPPGDFARRLRGFGPLGLLAFLLIYVGNTVFVPLSALLILLWAWLSQMPWREIGFSRPGSWIRTVAIGIVFGAVFKLVMKAVVMPLLGAPAINQAFHFLVGNQGALPRILYVVLVGAAFGEEVFFRGYLFERLGRLFGSAPWAKVIIVLLTSAWFGLEHYALQGIPGVEQAVIVGLVFGTIFAATRNLWLLIVAHAAFDLTAVAIIYYDLEAEVAHLIFK